MEYSQYQNNIFDWFQTGKGNGRIDAPAGSGKTFTGVAAVSKIPKGLTNPEIMYLAFNKHIAVELSQKLPDYAQSSTYHSFGFGAVRSAMGNVRVNQYKNSDILKARFGKEREKQAYYSLINRLVGLFKSNLDPFSEEMVLEYIQHYGLDIGEDGWDNLSLILSGVELLLDPSHCERLKEIDFDDMVWLPIVRNFPLPKHDYILVDEYQDTNRVQEEMVFRSVNGRGRVTAIGDPFQAIYGWRGAGTDMMDRFSQRMNATTLPLSITYRCPKAVVELVNREFPDIPFELWDQAGEGLVQELPEYKAHKAYEGGDMVLCRINAPLVKPAMNLLKERRKAVIKGRDIGKGLLTLIRKVERSYFPKDMPDFLDDLDTHVHQEISRLMDRDQGAAVSALKDKQETIWAFAEGSETVPEMKGWIERLFSDDLEGVTFSTVHKAKGLEANNVYILKPELMPFPKAQEGWQMQQEENLRYVAYTRAKNSLTFVKESAL